MPPKRSARASGPGSQAPGAPSYPEQLALLDTFQARIYPGVAGRALMASHLELANWHLENAIAGWRAERASLIARRQAQAQAQAAAQAAAQASQQPQPQAQPPTSSSRSQHRPTTHSPAGRRGSPSSRGRIFLRFRNPNARRRSTPPAPPQPPSPSYSPTLVPAVPITNTGVLRLRPSVPDTSSTTGAQQPPQQSSTQASKAKTATSAKGKEKEVTAADADADLDSEVIIPFNDNFEQERRDAALALRLHIEDRTGERGVMSPAEAVLLLHQHNWDLTQAATSFTTMQHARSGLARTYDQMRIPVQREIAPVEQEIPCMQQNERLAELINLTGRNDWYSLRVALQKHNWNLVAAVTQWFTKGIPPVEAPATVAPYGGVRMDVNLRPLPMPTRESTASAASREGWAPVPDEFARPAGEQDDSSSSDSEVSTLLRQRRKRPHGFMINSTRTTAKKGMRNDQKFLIEYVSRGRYWYNRFERQDTFKWPNVGFSEEAHGHHPNPDSSTLVEFDWNNQQHLHWLNNWRRQNIQRATGLQTREQAQRWSQEELDFLYALSEELLQELLQTNPKKTEGQLLPLKVTMDKKIEWAKRINEKFSGTIQPGSSQPRHNREPSALMTQRNRTRPIVDRFQLKADDSYFGKVERKAQRAKAAEEAAKGGVKRRREEEDSDKEGVLESDSEDENADKGHDDKRARTSEGGSE